VDEENLRSEDSFCDFPVARCRMDEGGGEGEGKRIMRGM
jgi:hypothetical protein